MAPPSYARLSPAETDALHRIAGLLLPASTEYNVPGADDPTIFADILRSISPRDAPDIRATLAELAALPPDADPATSTNTAALGRLILQCYYRDDRVLHALGLEPRAPFPKGHTVEQGDWSLLDPVRARPPFWRDDRSA